MDPLSLEKSYMTQKAQVNVYNEDLPFGKTLRKILTIGFICVSLPSKRASFSRTSSLFLSIYDFIEHNNKMCL